VKAAAASFVIATAFFVGGASAQTTINVSMTNYAFTPSTLTLKAGETYRIHFSNDSSKSHDFTAREFFQSATIASGDKPKLEDGDEVELDGGQSADITLTPNRAGTYAATCTHFMHAMLGMKGQIVVQ
jgi:plastocyanin